MRHGVKRTIVHAIARLIYFNPTTIIRFRGKHRQIGLPVSGDIIYGDQATASSQGLDIPVPGYICFPFLGKREKRRLRIDFIDTEVLPENS